MTFYSRASYDPLWESAQNLDVPIYVHPTYAPTSDVTEPGGRETPNGDEYTEFVAAMLSAHGFGWHVDTGLSFLRLWMGGVFDRFPDAKIVLGHMGETLPFMLDRVNANLGPVKGSGVKAWKKNVWVSTSGFSFSV
ncbi:hypothetical protein K504DRAFT_526767 [Pleomassaria siparia CBS 279.74]|uniref:Amidohydrolase-related domain-containing protein n=1 Tax=Pleomassaria siparia CBS 279.74 TaxID=1314801 RepID=A0A6G1K858_9PLEO|nr:hypothetical protein K504DRAFT_526767 [Pleomassaria siparia CBS 279.74]